MPNIIVQDEIFDLCPEFYRGIIVVRDIANHPSLKRVRKLLKKAVDGCADIDIAGDPRLASWDRAHAAFGSNPNKYPPSIKALIKRIKKNPALPYINSAVALFNYISLRYCLPCGGDDMQRVEGDFVLGRADGTESFAPLGAADTLESPEKGEVIYFDSATRQVMCRRWNWRNGDATKIESHTRRIVINVDCLPPIAEETADRARDEMAALLKEHCGADLYTDALHAGKRVLAL